LGKEKMKIEGSEKVNRKVLKKAKFFGFGKAGGREAFWLVFCLIASRGMPWRIRWVSSQRFIQTKPRFGSQISASFHVAPAQRQARGSYPKLAFDAVRRHFRGATNLTTGRERTEEFCRCSAFESGRWHL